MAGWGREYLNSLPLRGCSHNKIAYNTYIPTPPEAPPPTPQTGRMTSGTQRRGRFPRTDKLQHRKIATMELTGKLRVTRNDGCKEILWSHEDIVTYLAMDFKIDPGQELMFAKMYALCSPSDQKMIGNNFERMQLV